MYYHRRMSEKVGMDSREWFLQAKYDLKSADVMFNYQHDIRAVFMCHLAVLFKVRGTIHLYIIHPARQGRAANDDPENRYDDSSHMLPKIRLTKKPI